MGLFSKKAPKKNALSDGPKTNEEKRNELLQKDPAAYVAISFFTLADLFAKENGAFTSPTGRIDFWAFLHWFSWDILEEADPGNEVIGCFCDYLQAVRSYTESDLEAAIDYLCEVGADLCTLYISPADTPLMIICGEAIQRLYGRRDPILSLSFAQYLARSAQIVCEAFPKNK